MAKVNWNAIASEATRLAKARGQEANVTQVKNALNDMAACLLEDHEPWEILEAVYRLGEKGRSK